MSPRVRDGLEFGLQYLNLLLIFVFYGTVARMARATGVDWSPWIHTPIDTALPLDFTLFGFYMAAFVSSTILMVLVYLRAGIPVMRRFFVAGAVSMVCCFTFYLLFPISHAPLIDAVPRLPDSYFYQVIAGIPLYNACPSMHIVNAWMAYRLYAAHYSEFRRLNLAFFAAVAASTMLLKQHYLVDVISGMAVGELAMRLLVHGDRASGHPLLKRSFFGPRALAAQAVLLGILLTLHAEKLRRKHARISAAALVDIDPRGRPGQ